VFSSQLGMASSLVVCEDANVSSEAEKFFQQTLERLAPIASLDRNSAERLINIGIRYIPA
jgi:hypothetical protein